VLVGKSREVFYGIAALNFNSATDFRIQWDEKRMFRRDKDQVTQRSLTTNNEYALKSVLRFRDACEFVRNGRIDRAARLIRTIDSNRLHRHLAASRVEYQRLSNRAARPLRVYPRIGNLSPGRVSKLQTRGVYERDHWTCRWCETPVIAEEALHKMSLVFPEEFPRGRRRDETHGLILSCRTRLDHVMPTTFGGSLEASNQVTACGACFAARGSDIIERLGLDDPRSLSSVHSDWDGCAGFR
jgi:hypothetical protein